MARFAFRRELRSNMRRIGCLIIFLFMATETGVGGICVTPRMTGNTISCNGGMGALEWIIIVVYRESGRLPARISTMASLTSQGYPQCDMTWIGRLIIILVMTVRTNGRGPGIAIGMTVKAGSGDMCPGQREKGKVVVKAACSLPGRMAFETSLAVIKISPDTGMLFIRVGLVVIMAVDAAEQAEVGSICVAIRAGFPFPVMFATVNREELSIMVKCGRGPGHFVMTRYTFGRKPTGGMRRVDGLVVIIFMTAEAGIGGIIVIARMTGKAIGRYIRMRSCQGIVIVVVWKCSRFPFRFSGMAQLAIS